MVRTPWCVADLAVEDEHRAKATVVPKQTWVLYDHDLPQPKPMGIKAQPAVKAKQPPLLKSPPPKPPPKLNEDEVAPPWT